MKKTLVVNLFGGPGVAKSTTAAGLFHILKTNGYNAELVVEYAKDKIWEESTSILSDQLYVMANQFHRQWILNNKVDVIVTDSPFPLSIHYKFRSKMFSKNPIAYKFDSLIMGLFNEFKNKNFLIVRKNKYSQHGRYQSEESARITDTQIEKMMRKYDIKYQEIDGVADAPMQIFEKIKKHLPE